MKSSTAFFEPARSAGQRWAVCLAVLAATGALSVAAGVPRLDLGKPFPSPEQAAEALAAAARTKDHPALQEIFGPAGKDLQMSDQVQADTELAGFSSAFDDGHRIVRQSDGRATLEVGANHWPFPVPLVRRDGQWYFDTEAGKEEILNRRVGRNELSALNAARAYVEAQRDYASRDRDDDGVLEYAQHLLSAPGRKDGLYWPPSLDGALSPLGPLVAAAHAEGYRTGTGEQSGPRPFHGYYFKILSRQGRHAPGGKYNYVINGNMIGGFALVAWPADYGDSGVMTFIVNQQGRVYQKDLGSKTASLAKAMTEYDPDKTWTLSPD